jgi:hypothetical protein
MPVACLATLCIAVALSAPGTADARPTQAPPGNSAVQEFVETLSEAGGSRVTNDIANTLPAPPRTGAVSAETRSALEQLGPPGEAAGSLAAATAAFAGPRPARATTVSPDGKAPPVAALERLVGGSGPGGMGLALPILAVLGVLAALGHRLTRASAAGPQ